MSDNLNLEDLLFVSNTIELKPDKKYFMVFKGMTVNQLEHVIKGLQEVGMDCLGIALKEGQDVQVIEAPKSELELKSTPLPRNPFFEAWEDRGAV